MSPLVAARVTVRGARAMSSGGSADLSQTELYYVLKVPREAKSHGGREVGDENGDGRKKGVSLAVAVQ